MAPDAIFTPNHGQNWVFMSNFGNRDLTESFKTNFEKVDGT